VEEGEGKFLSFIIENQKFHPDNTFSLMGKEDVSLKMLRI